MKKLLLILFILLMALPIPARAEGESLKLYLVPIETNGMFRGPQYFQWGFEPDPTEIGCRWNMMDYGFAPYALLVTHDISAADHTALIAHVDVYNFPDNLDQPVNKAGIETFFEGINLPTDWLTPSTTYRELLRNVAGMMQFNQRYSGISGGHSIFENATLNTRLRNLSAQEQEWFYQTAESFGFLRSQINTNAQLRQLVRQAAGYWQSQPFYLGGYEF